MVDVFLDSKKAFHTVDHDMLLSKLYKLGIRGNIHKWFQSYLQNRTQYPDYCDISFETLKVIHVIPQGS